MPFPVPVLVAMATFVVMEPVTAFLHRVVFHGFGWGLHRSHHRVRSQGLEANDLYPFGIAAFTIALMGIGASVSSVRALLWVGAGMTAYGAAYFLVHDCYIHRRLPVFPAGREIAVLELMAKAHEFHHRFGAAPYGMLFPQVPGDLRGEPHTGILRRPS